MLRRIPPALVLAFLVSACSDHGTGPSDPPTPGSVAGAISDAENRDGDWNPGFWWLSPMVPSPSTSGTFQPGLSPKVVVVFCGHSEEPDCNDPVPSPIAEFSRANGGLIVEPDHFKVEFDTHAFALEPTTDTEINTYRIFVFTDPLTEFGGPFIIGYADFQLAENGKEAKNLQSDEIIALVDGRTLPIRFFINEEAYPHELRTNAAQTTSDPDEEPLCQINCSVTVVQADEPTTALLEDPVSGEAVTGIDFPANVFDGTALVVIDERRTEETSVGPVNCAPEVVGLKKNCFLYEASGADFTGIEFRFGICPVGVDLGDGTADRITKVDYDDGGNVISVTNPPEADVSDFLPCGISTASTGSSTLHRFANSLLNFFVPAAFAGDQDRWGGTAEDFSHVYWETAAEMVALTSSVSAEAGTSAPVTVRVEAMPHHADDPSFPLDRARVTFEIPSGAGSLSAPLGEIVEQTSTRITILSGTSGLASGEATVEWTLAQGSFTMNVSSPDAGPASGLEIPGTGTAAGDVLFGVNASDDGLSRIDLATGDATFIGPIGDGFTTPVSLAVRPSDGALFAHSNTSPDNGGPVILSVDPCTGAGTVVLSLPSDGQASAFDGADVLFVATGGNLARVVDGSLQTVGPLVDGQGQAINVFGMDFAPDGGVYGVHVNGAGTAAELVAIDPATGTARRIGAFADANGNAMTETPGSVVFDPQGRLLLSTLTGAVYVVDPETAVVTPLVTLTQLMQGLGFAPEPNCVSPEPVLFGVNASDDGLSRIALATGDVTFIGAIGDGFTTPVSLAVRPSDGALFAHSNTSPDNGGPVILSVNACTGAGTILLSLTDAEADGLAIDDADVLFVATGGNLARVVDGSLQTVGPLVDGQGQAINVFGMDFAPDGRLYAVHFNAVGTAADLVTIDPATGTATRIGSFADASGNAMTETPGSVVFDPQGRLLLSTLTGAVYVVDPITAEVTPLVMLTQLMQGLGFAPEPTCIG